MPETGCEHICPIHPLFSEPERKRLAVMMEGEAAAYESGASMKGATQAEKELMLRDAELARRLAVSMLGRKS